VEKVEKENVERGKTSKKQEKKVRKENAEKENVEIKKELKGKYRKSLRR
jgi:hypothetical protein